jgi:hypothetical protein
MEQEPLNTTTDIAEPLWDPSGHVSATSDIGKHIPLPVISDDIGREFAVIYAATARIEPCVEEVIRQTSTDRQLQSEREITQVHPTVRRFVKVSITALHEHGLIPTGRYALAGGYNPASMARPTSSPADDRKCRIYFPHFGKPDIELSFWLDNQFKITDDFERGQQYFTCAAPPMEVKTAFSDNMTKRYVDQAAGHGIRWILRVFPMIAEKDVLDIFPDRCVYVPLLSNGDVYLLKIKVKELEAGGGFLTSITKKQSDDRHYVTTIMCWLVWASKVVSKLQKKEDELKALVPRNCWVPAEVFARTFRNVDAKDLIPKPSFFNPIYVHRHDRHFYRVTGSYWCGQGPIDPAKIWMQCPQLFEGWICLHDGICMPNLGDHLRRTHVDNIPKLKNVLQQLLSALKSLGDAGYAHMDLRAPNVLVNSTGKVTIIDYDHTSRFGERSHKKALPEPYVHRNSDMWWFGEMMYRILMVSAAAGAPPFHIMPELAAHGELIREFLERCMNADPDQRPSAQGALAEIEAWPDA